MPYWAQVLIFALVTVFVVLLLIKRIRRRERADLDAPELVLTEDGELRDTTGKGVDAPDKDK
ncbi:MAG: hypothetical protein AAFY59_08985 [Pseudomonadota bacterium]